MDFVDLQGASGRSYRFRLWPASGEHPAIAGNYVVLRMEDRTIVELGVLEDLSCVKRDVSANDGDHQLFTRLNISRANREAEHADLSVARAQGAVTPGA